MITATFSAPRGSAGFTLIELMVSLALFALISLAGISLVETVIGVQQRTASRADRLAEIQRGLYLVTADFEQLTSGPALDSNTVTLARGTADGSYSVQYRFDAGALHRIANGTDRTLISGLRSARWRFLKPAGWSELPVTREEPERPLGIEIAVELEPGPGRVGGPVRRVIQLPREP